MRKILKRMGFAGIVMSFCLLMPDAVAKEQNLLPELKAGFAGPLGDWSCNIGRKDGAFRPLPGAGLEGSTAVADAGGLYCAGIPLVPGETYRFGAYVRTKNFASKDSRFVVYDFGWKGKELESGPIPADTQGRWVKVEGEGTLEKKGGNGHYVFRISAPGGEKGLDVCRPFLYGVSAKAKAEGKVYVSPLAEIRRLIPVTPVLTRLDAAAPEILFTYVCPLEEREPELDFRMRLCAGDAPWSPWRTFPVPADRKIRCRWDQVPAGAGRIEVALVRKRDGKELLANAYDVRFLEPLPPVPEKRLNNLVTELLRSPLKNGPVSFSVPREGWIYLGFTGTHPEGKALLDGTEEIITFRPGEASETMRCLSRGHHKLTISGVTQSAGSELVIRTVPEIAIFPVAVWPETNVAAHRYGPDFWRKYGWHSMNTFFHTHAWRPKTAFLRDLDAEIRQRGVKLLGCQGFPAGTWIDAGKMMKNMRQSTTLTTTAGRAMDEAAANADPAVFAALEETCWNLTGMDKFLYLWMAETCNYMNYPPLHLPLISAVSNAGQGRGKLLMETYAESTPDLASLKERYQFVRKHLQFAQKSAPDAAERMMFVMSGLLTSGCWDCNAWPQSDVRYALDYFFHLVATVPEAKGLAGVGCYNVNYSDEEQFRWIGKLLRHYAVEGHTEMLSPRYGIQYNPGFLADGDFRSGLKGWEVSPAEPGSIRPRTIKGYGRRTQARRGVGHGNGDTVIEFIRSAKRPNRISRMLSGFEPGKTYSLTFVTADGEDVKKKIKRHADFAFEAELEGAEVIPEPGYVFRNPQGPKVYRVEVVTHKVVFRAKSRQIRLSFLDWKNDREPGAPAGRRRILNFVSILPYLPAE